MAELEKNFDLRVEGLENRWVRLDPLDARHAAALREACAADPEIWTLYPYSFLGEAFDESWAALAAQAAAGQALNFAVLQGGAVVGMTRYISLDAANRSAEIGGTYYRPDARGGVVNPAVKRLILGHAFDRGARRVLFRVDALNARSRAAVLKLGAVQEGILRQDRVTWTGRVRDTVIFSILASEWPQVRAGLDARLAAATSAAP